MTFDQAAAAIQESVASDPEFTPGLPADQSEQQQQIADQAAEPTPGEQGPDPGATEFASPEVDESFMGSDFNPDLLPDELKPGFKQLQGAFTRKTQELAEQRKQFESLGDVEQLRQAQEFYSSLQDPEYLKAFYKELGSVVQEMGLEVDPTAPVAPEPAAEPVAPELPAELKQIAESDPELQPFLDRFQQMEQRLQSFESAQAEREQALADERALMAQAAEIDRQVQVVREAHPEYADEDWQAIYDRAVAYDGDVLQAAEAFQSDRDRIIAGYLAQKQTPTPAAPLPNPGTVTESTEQEPMTLEDADRAAQAYLDANDLREFTG
jgi:hypothetical protein